MIGVARPRAQPADHVHPVDPGKAEIQDHHVRMGARRDLQRPLAVGRGLDVVAPRAQVRAQAAEDLRFVVDDQDARHGSALNASTIVSPPPGVSSTSTSPPIASTNPRATARPRPDPVARRAIAQPLERLEHALAFVERDARAAIDDPELDAAAGLRAEDADGTV